MLNGKQVRTMVFILFSFFAIPAMITSYLTDTLQDSRGRADSNNGIDQIPELANVGPFSTILKYMPSNADFYYILATILVIAFILLIYLTFQKKEQD